MSHFDHILVPTDFGDASDAAVQVALELAERFRAKLTLLHVQELSPSAYAFYGAALVWPVAKLDTPAQKELDELLTRIREKCPSAEAHMLIGTPREQILEAARTYAVSLIVLGTHGRRGLSRALLGSVAEGVVRLAPVPVLTVRGNLVQGTKDKTLAEGDPRAPGGPTGESQ